MYKKVAFLLILVFVSARIFEKTGFASSSPWVSKAPMQLARASGQRLRGYMASGQRV